MGAAAKLLGAVDRVRWDAHVEPDEYRPSDPPRAFRSLVSAQAEGDSRSAYNQMLFAIGNNHRGSYYPAARDAVPLLVQAAVTLSGWPRHTAVEVLTDLVISFGPDDGETEILDVFCKAVASRTGHAVADADVALDLLRTG